MPVVTATISSNGQALNPAWGVLSIDIRKEVDHIPQAEVRLLDGSVAKRKFEISNRAFFVPGASIEIKLRYEGKRDKTVFSGVVVRHGVEALAGCSVLVIGLKDVAVCMTAGRKSAVFRDKSDAAIIRKLIREAGLKIGEIPDTQPEHPEMVQYHCTPWDFILSRADAQGLLTVVENGKVSMKKMQLSGEATRRFAFGLSTIFELEIEADAGDQPTAVKSRAWDWKQQQMTEPKEAASMQLSPGNLDGASLAESLGNGTRELLHPVPLAEGELKAWADAEMARSRMALLRGRITVPGSNSIRLLDIIAISGVGARFNGKTMVTGLRHRYDAQGWRTDVQFGITPDRFAQRARILDAPAAGLLPAVSGLQLGVVADFEEDPEGELRVKVMLPCVDAKKSAAVWARLCTPDAGEGRGFYFRPEPNDEVVVGFLNSDPRCPVILGSLFGSKNTPPEDVGTPSEENDKRGIITKKGIKLGFVDSDDPVVFIETKKAKLLLHDEDEVVSLSDQAGNSIKLSKDGIEIKSAKALSIKADEAVEISGSEVNIK